MKVLLVDDVRLNRLKMKQMLMEQMAINVDVVLEADNSVMAKMLIETKRFDLYILDGKLNNFLPDGSVDGGSGYQLAEKIIQLSPEANVVCWTQESSASRQFQRLFREHGLSMKDAHFWPKQLSVDTLQSHLNQLFPKTKCPKIQKIANHHDSVCV